MEEYPISYMYRDARVMNICAGTNEIVKVLIARSLRCQIRLPDEYRPSL
jgi:acyl-CoA dehydrogenase